jgi:hypothetical protein
MNMHYGASIVGAALCDITVCVSVFPPWAEILFGLFCNLRAERNSRFILFQGSFKFI